MLFMDPQMEYITIAKVRRLTIKSLRDLRHPLVINGKTRPEVIIVPYAQYLAFQEAWILATEMARQLAETAMKDYGLSPILDRAGRA